MTRFFNFILILLLNSITKKKNNHSLENIKNILFVRFDNKLGDTVIDTFFIRELKKQIPQSKLTVMIREPYDELLRNNPNINKIIIMPKIKKWYATFAKLPYLYKQKYDLVIDIPWGGTLKRILYLFLINSKNVMSANTKGYNFINYKLIWEPKMHMTEVFIKALEILGSKNINKDYDIFLSRNDEQFVDDFLKTLDLKKEKILILNTQGASVNRTFSKEKVFEILTLLKQNKKLKIILLDYQNKFNQFTNIVSLFQSNNITQVAALIKKSDIILTVDTGILHIADTYNKDLIVFYANDKFSVFNNKILFSSKNFKTIYLKSDGTVNNIDIKTIADAIQTWSANSETN